MNKLFKAIAIFLVGIFTSPCQSNINHRFFGINYVDIENLIGAKDENFYQKDTIGYVNFIDYGINHLYGFYKSMNDENNNRVVVYDISYRTDIDNTHEETAPFKEIKFFNNITFITSASFNNLVNVYIDG